MGLELHQIRLTYGAFTVTNWSANTTFAAWLHFRLQPTSKPSRIPSKHQRILPNSSKNICQAITEHHSSGQNTVQAIKLHRPSRKKIQSKPFKNTIQAVKEYRTSHHGISSKPSQNTVQTIKEYRPIRAFPCQLHPPCWWKRRDALCRSRRKHPH